ncbi:PucR family transcriptional regulator [Microbacterium fluvii]|uniref:PucR family transcriptional regulator n=1 Tax=Microbacterium fluvii TaxID=415215 RepID=A0ABW2HEJ2_9MICO|nr:PucR family transcriptional regulator [Microbacterium fluvii]MCU4673133.1 PucR family transcriptional regulator [Microbacterium fluvii]
MIRTDRPTLGVALPTVREVLALEAFGVGVPEVLVGDEALDARVRWAHVSDSAGVARLLDGGELLLSTGSGWPSEPADLVAFVAGLASAGLSALVLELGTHYRYVPAVVVETARAHGLALVALHREVKFVALTEAVHSRIILEQTAALRARDEVRERFTALALRGSPADFVVHQLAQTLQAPVVLENLAHEVVAADVPLAMEEELFTRWEVRSRIAHRERAVESGPEEWLIVPVEARGTRWGHLVALPGPPHAAGRAAVLEQGAIALALGRLADGDGDEWGRIGRRQLVDGLLAGRFAGPAGAAARLEAAGLPVEGSRLYGMVAAGAPVTAEAVDAAARALGGRALAGSAPAGVGAPAAVLLVSLPVREQFDDAAARAFASALAPDAARLVLSVGSRAEGFEAGLMSLQEAIDLARGRIARAERGPVVRRADERPLARLVTSLRDDHRLLDHGERMLAPLIEYDLGRGGDLLDVLGAMVAHPGNRTAAASASHLSRSVFYQRIALIQDLLGADLDDGEVQAALHLALLVRRSAAR